MLQLNREWLMFQLAIGGQRKRFKENIFWLQKKISIKTFSIYTNTHRHTNKYALTHTRTHAQANKQTHTYVNTVHSNIIRHFSHFVNVIVPFKFSNACRCYEIGFKPTLFRKDLFLISKIIHGRGSVKRLMTRHLNFFRFCFDIFITSVV